MVLFCAKLLNSYFNHSQSHLAPGPPKAGPRAPLLSMCHPWAWEGKSCWCHRTRTHHFTSWEPQIRAVNRERSPELPSTLQFAVAQSQASETTTESASHFKAQLSNSPLTNIFCVDDFKIGFLELCEKLWQKGQRFHREPDSSLVQHPHPAQLCVSHLGWGPGHGKEPQDGFLSTAIPALLFVTGNWGGHQL